MRSTGRIVTWNDAKGFGFIEPAAGGKQVFVHISALRGLRRSAALGAEVSYVEAHDANGRSRADEVRLLGADHAPGPAVRAFLTSASFLLTVLALVALNRIPLLVVWLYLALSLLSLLQYAMDKSAAQRGKSRIPENTLHLVALAGGWPGALIAQQWLRHKSAKTSFRIVFWISVVLNLAGLAWLATSKGAQLLQTLGLAD